MSDELSHLRQCAVWPLEGSTTADGGHPGGIPEGEEERRRRAPVFNTGDVRGGPEQRWLVPGCVFVNRPGSLDLHGTQQTWRVQMPLEETVLPRQ